MKAKPNNFHSIFIFKSLKEDVEAQNELLKTRIKANKRLIESYQKEIELLEKMIQEE